MRMICWWSADLLQSGVGWGSGCCWLFGSLWCLVWPAIKSAKICEILLVGVLFLLLPILFVNCYNYLVMTVVFMLLVTKGLNSKFSVRRLKFVLRRGKWRRCLRLVAWFLFSRLLLPSLLILWHSFCCQKSSVRDWIRWCCVSGGGIRMMVLATFSLQHGLLFVIRNLSED